MRLWPADEALKGRRTPRVGGATQGSAHLLFLSASIPSLLADRRTQVRFRAPKRESARKPTTRVGYSGGNTQRD
jgi:hypothetical protein